MCVYTFIDVSLSLVLCRSVVCCPIVPEKDQRAI